MGGLLAGVLADGRDVPAALPTSEDSNATPLPTADDALTDTTDTEHLLSVDDSLSVDESSQSHPQPHTQLTAGNPRRRSVAKLAVCVAAVGVFVFLVAGLSSLPSASEPPVLIWSDSAADAPPPRYRVYPHGYLLPDDELLVGQAARWTSGASSRFQSFLHAHQYSEHYAASLNHSAADIFAQCEQRRFLVWRQRHYGLFSRVNIYLHAFLAHLATDLVFVLDQQGLTQDGDQGMLDWLMPCSTCQDYAIARRAQWTNLRDLDANITSPQLYHSLHAVHGAAFNLSLSRFNRTRFFVSDLALKDAGWWTWNPAPAHWVLQLPIRAELTAGAGSVSVSDAVWSTFVVHQVRLFFCRPRPRIALLAEQMMVAGMPGAVMRPLDAERSDDQSLPVASLPSAGSLSLVGLQVRRGDKASEDPYYSCFHRFRPISQFTQRALDPPDAANTTTTASSSTVPFSHYLLATDDDALTSQVRQWSVARPGDSPVQPADSFGFGESSNATEAVLLWRGLSSLHCPPVEQRSVAYVRQLSAHISNYRSDVTEATKRDKLAAALQQLDCFIATVYLLASTNTAVTVVTEASNIADHIQQWRCALERASACTQVRQAGSSPPCATHPFYNASTTAG